MLSVNKYLEGDTANSYDDYDLPSVSGECLASRYPYPLISLPAYILQNIFNYSDIPTLGKFFRTCNYFAQKIIQVLIWENIVHKTFKSLALEALHPAHAGLRTEDELENTFEMLQHLFQKNIFKKMDFISLNKGISLDTQMAIQKALPKKVMSVLTDSQLDKCFVRLTKEYWGISKIKKSIENSLTPVEKLNSYFVAKTHFTPKTYVTAGSIFLCDESVMEYIIDELFPVFENERIHEVVLVRMLTKSIGDESEKNRSFFWLK